MKGVAVFVIMLAVAATSSVAAAAGSAIENILVSKVNGITRLQIWPACPMRYVDHSPQTAGLELRIRVVTGSDCRELLDGDSAPEQYFPDSLRLGNVEEVLFDADAGNASYITLRFKTPQSFEVRQRAVGWLEVFVDTGVDSATLPPSMPEPLSPESPPAVADLPREESPRPAAPRPLRRAETPPPATGNFVVQLGVFDDADRAIAALTATSSDHFAYTTSFTINGRTWHGLQVGFFDTEADAESLLAGLADRFPDAWVRYVTTAESTAAKSRGDVRVADSSAEPVQVAENPGDASNVPALMSQGRQALLGRRYDEAIAAYSGALRIGGHVVRAEAREMIAIAYERRGDTRRAVAEYEAFLAEFPGNDAAGRVSDRLVALETAAIASESEDAAVVIRQATSGWEVRGGISHYYWRNEEQRVHDGDYLVSSSGVLGLADMTASRSGSRFDILARFNGAYQHDLEPSGRTGDVSWISNAYVDLTDKRLGFTGRVGRQMRRQDGVPGRFDGIGLGYRWRPSTEFSMSAGVPIDSPRYVSDSRRKFFAASASIDDMLDGRLGVNAFTHQQVVDGIYDRQAIGGDLRYRDGGMSIVGLVDYDLSYAKLNTLLVNANIATDRGWTFNGRVHYGARPYLTTRNALAGQTATSIDALLETYSEAQVRRIARDRTAEALTASAGITMPWGERLSLTLDVATRQSDGTVASAGVAAIPATGTQMFYSARAVATNILKRNDLISLTGRYESLRNRTASTLIADARFPVTRSLRINPRLEVSNRQSNETTERQLIVSPSLRILWRLRNVLLDFEAGGRWSNRELPPTEPDPFTPDGIEDLYGGFVRLGYRLEF